MNRFEQRLKKRMTNPEFAAGFREMDSEISIIDALNEAREILNISKEELATRMGKSRTSVSRLFNDENANPTLETITEALAALGLSADIKLRRSGTSERQINIEMAL